MEMRMYVQERSVLKVAHLVSACVWLLKESNKDVAYRCSIVIHTQMYSKDMPDKIIPESTGHVFKIKF